jgi:general secretion pathway protein G
MLEISPGGGRQEGKMFSNTEEARSEKGWTLMELIIVLVILGLLAAVVGPKVYDKVIKSKDQIAKIQIGELESALQLFSFDVGRFPLSAEGLESLVQNTGNISSWKGPYITKAVPKDPWDRPYVYRSPGTNGEYEIYSFGADGTEGNDDDICSWK